MRWAAPESPMTRPTIAPSPMVSIVSPIWSPMPSERTSGIFSSEIHRTRPTPTATSSRAAKPLSLSLVMSSSRTSTLIPTTRSGTSQFPLNWLDRVTGDGPRMTEGRWRIAADR